MIKGDLCCLVKEQGTPRENTREPTAHGKWDVTCLPGVDKLLSPNNISRPP